MNKGLGNPVKIGRSGRTIAAFMQAVCIALRAISVEHFPPCHHVAVAPISLDQLVNVVAALAVAFGAFDAEHVELAFDVAEDEIGAGHAGDVKPIPAAGRSTFMRGSG
jgi:hypothetical protein